MYGTCTRGSALGGGCVCRFDRVSPRSCIYYNPHRLHGTSVSLADMGYKPPKKYFFWLGRDAE